MVLPTGARELAQTKICVPRDKYVAHPDVYLERQYAVIATVTERIYHRTRRRCADVITQIQQAFGDVVPLH